MMTPMPKLIQRHTVGRDNTWEKRAAPKPMKGNQVKLAQIAPTAKSQRPDSPYWLAMLPSMTTTST